MSHLNCPSCNQGLLWMDNWDQNRGSNLALHVPMRYDQGWNGPWSGPHGVIPHSHGPMPFPQHPLTMMTPQNFVPLNGRNSRPPSPAMSTRSRFVC